MKLTQTLHSKHGHPNEESVTSLAHFPSIKIFFVFFELALCEGVCIYHAVCLSTAVLLTQ